MIAVSVLEKNILALSEPLANVLGLAIVRVRIMGRDNPVLQIMIEKNKGEDTDVDGCASFSRLFSKTIDLEQAGCGACQLEISTPGIDRPLTRPGDFGRWVGHRVKIELAVPIGSSRRYKGIIVCEDEKGVTVRLDDGTELVVALNRMRKAQLILTDKLIAASDNGYGEDIKTDPVEHDILNDEQTRKVESR